MKNVVKKYGLYAALTSAMLFVVSFMIGRNLSYGTQEVLGYISIILPLVFVYFAIKYYRDTEKEGFISFKEALMLGLMITLCTAIAIAFADLLITTVIYPEFVTEYSETMLQKLKETVPAEQFEVKKAELMAQIEAYGTPGFMALLMFVTVMLIGFVMSLLSSLILKRTPAMA